jgi:hypothetical protein
MADNLWRPGDTDNKVLQKILATLQFGLVTPPNSNVTTIVNNATTNSNNNTSAPAPGNVGGYTSVIRAAPTVTTGSAYSSGNDVGGLITLSGALRVSNGTGILESLILADTSNQAAAMTFIIFNVNPSGATITDKSAFVYGTNIVNVVAQVNIAGTDYTVLNSTAVAVKSGLGIALRGAAGNTTLYAALVTTGTPTWATATPLNLFVGILQD